MSGKIHTIVLERGTAEVASPFAHAIKAALLPKTFTSLETRILRFAMKRRLKTDLPSRLKKLGEEFGELAEAIAKNDPIAIRKESADVAIVLSHIGIVCGFSLHQAATDKLTEVERRHAWKRDSQIKSLHFCSRCGATTRDLVSRKNEECPEAK